MGVADREAADEIELRLARGDEETARGVALAREMVSALALIAPSVEPPPAVKRRLLSAVGKEPRGISGWLWAWAAATALLAVVAVNFWQREQVKNAELAAVRQELLRTTESLTQSNARLETVSQLVEFLNEPSLRIANFGKPDPTPPRGRVLVSPDKGVLLLVANLPPAAAGRTYEMWLVPKAGSPIPAGLFQTSAAGQALHINQRTVDLSQIAAIAVSNEPQAGSAAPTTTPFIIAPLSAGE
jgi:anti-sigma-K factor RskA